MQGPMSHAMNLPTSCWPSVPHLGHASFRVIVIAYELPGLSVSSFLQRSTPLCLTFYCAFISLKLKDSRRPQPTPMSLWCLLAARCLPEPLCWSLAWLLSQRHSSLVPFLIVFRDCTCCCIRKRECDSKLASAAEEHVCLFPPHFLLTLSPREPHRAAVKVMP